MIKKLALTNFRKHEDLTLVFEQGLISLRALNEGGKSTVLEAMMYALYGSRALRNSLSNTVTYGLKDHLLKVEATFDFDGEEYKFIRHKGGAEVYVNGSPEPYVTGQTEVTTFSARLIGADANTANKLMMASQGNLRGALEQGPKATAEMIEDLADFDLFDFLLAAMGKDLALGSAANLERTLAELEESLDEFGQIDYANTIQEHIKKITTNSAEQKGMEKNLEHVQEDYRKENEKLTQAYVGVEQAREANKALADHKKQLEIDKGKHLDLKKKAEQVVSDVEIQALQDQLEAGRTLEQRAKVYATYKGLPSFDVEWEGDREGLEAEIASKGEKEEALQKSYRDAESKIALLKSRIITETDCPTCHQPLADHKSIEAKNAQVQSQLDKIDLQATKGKYLEAKEEHDELVKFNRDIQPIYNFIEMYGAYVAVDNQTAPPKISWVGEVPDVASFDKEKTTKELNTLIARKQEIAQAESNLPMLEQIISNTRANISKVEKEIQGIHVEDVDALKAKVNDLKEKVNETSQNLQTLRQEGTQHLLSMENAKSKQEYEQSSRKQIEDQIKRIKDQVSDLDFNNNLLKKVRLARPLVSDQLWNMVLAAVSTMFTSIRGVRSVVTKDKDGFKVNGEDVTGLSGSTLDILGASIRIALIRTFIPNCPFVVYDEPFAAMDSDRSSSMLSFIQSTGFRQTLVVTHEDLTEQVANQLITL